MSMRAIYTQAVRKHLAGYFGNWEPGAPIALGDYGFQVGAAFERLGSLSALGLTWKVRASPSGGSHQKFTSSSAVKATASAKGSARGARAALKIDFGARSAVFADFAGCTYRAIEDKQALGQQLLANPGFDQRWVVVTDLFKVRRSIIAISSSAGASVTFEADAALPAIDLADAKAGLKAGAQNSIGYLVDAQRDLTPIIGLCGFRERFWSPGKDLRALAAGPATRATAAGLSDPVFLQLS